MIERDGDGEGEGDEGERLVVGFAPPGDARGGWGNDSLESVLCRLLDGVPLAAELARLDLRERGKYAISGPHASEVQENFMRDPSG